MEEKPRLSDRIRRTARFKHLSLRTENSYLNWIRRFYLYCNRRDPARLGKEEIRNFLSHLATDKHVAASTQNQAFSAILFLYRDVLQIKLPQIEHVERPRIKKRIPVIFTRSQAKAVLSEMNGIHKLMASLLYGSGLRVMECVRLRVKDLDLHRTQIVGARYKRAKCANYLASTLIKTTSSKDTSSMFNSCIQKISRKDSERSIFRMPSNENTRVPLRNGAGSTFFPQRKDLSIPLLAKYAGTMRRNPYSNEP